MGARTRCIRRAATGGTHIKARLDIAIVAGAALVLILLAYANSTTTHQAVSVSSTFDTGPNGYRALYEVLRTTGVPVRRFERVVAVLDPSIKTLIVSGYENDPSQKPLDQRDASAIKRFVEGGGRFVAIDTDFAGRNDITPGVGTSHPAKGATAIALARNAFTAGVTRVRGPLSSVFPFRSARGVPLLANDRGMVAVWYRFGRGEVIAMTAPALFGNAQLRNADNLRFAYNAIANHGEAAFDEYVHGYDDRLTMWAALPAPVHAALWVVLLTVGLLLIGANVPFAPPYLPEPADERDSFAYIAGVAELMRRSRHRPADADVVWRAAIDFQRRKEHG
jgi:Domain of unknown function (DUF4350)